MLPNTNSSLAFVWMKVLDTEVKLLQSKAEASHCASLHFFPPSHGLSPYLTWLLSPCRAHSTGAFAHPIEGEGERLLSWLALHGDRLLGALEGCSQRKAVSSYAVFHGRHWPGHKEMTAEKPCSFAAIPNHQQKVSSEDWVTSSRCDCKGCLFQKGGAFCLLHPLNQHFQGGTGVTQINRTQLQNDIVST